MPEAGSWASHTVRRQVVSLDKLQPIGSVLVVGERRYVVVGHRMTRDGDHVGAGYLLVPYPLGFVDADSLQLVPASKTGAVLHAGLCNETGSAYLGAFEALATANEALSYEEYQSSVRLLHDFAAQEGGTHA